MATRNYCAHWQLGSVLRSPRHREFCPTPQERQLPWKPWAGAVETQDWPVSIRGQTTEGVTS